MKIAELTTTDDIVRRGTAITWSVPVKHPLAGTAGSGLDSNWHSPAVVKNVVSLVLTNFDSGVEF